MANEVVGTTTSMTISWVGEGAGTYQCQINEYPEFSGTLEYDGTGTLATGMSAAHTITQGQQKYYVRHRYKASSAYGYWSEISSFYYNASAGTNVVIADDYWHLYNSADTTDAFTFQVNPISYSIAEGDPLLTQSRNLLGTLLTQRVTTKSVISLDFSEQSYIGANQKEELIRYYNMQTSKYLAKRFAAQDGVNYVYKIWKVEFTSPISAECLGQLSLSFEEI